MKHESDNPVLVCAVCHDLSSFLPQSTRDKKLREGYFQYHSAGGCNPVTRHGTKIHERFLAAVEKLLSPLDAAESYNKKIHALVQTTLSELLNARSSISLGIPAS